MPLTFSIHPNEGLTKEYREILLDDWDVSTLDRALELARRAEAAAFHLAAPTEDARPAHEIEARACSTPRAVNSFAVFFERQADHASEWERDNRGEVARWAHSLASHLRDRAAIEREDDQLRRKLA